MWKGQQQDSALTPSAAASSLSGRANCFSAAGVLWAPPEVAGFRKANKYGGRACFHGETLNFLIYEAVVFINCPILLGLIHGLGKSLSLWFSIQAERCSGVISLGRKLTLQWLEGDNFINNNCNIILVPTMGLIWMVPYMSPNPQSNLYMVDIITHLIQMKKSKFGKGMQLVQCHTARKWWCVTHTQIIWLQSPFWGPAIDS